MRCGDAVANPARTTICSIVNPRASGAPLDTAAGGLRDNQTLEVIALELRIGVNAVGEIVGKTTTEDLLDSIFSQFCIGK